MSEQKKYLDLEGLSHFWNKAKDYQQNQVKETLYNYAKIYESQGATSLQNIFDKYAIHNQSSDYRNIFKFSGTLWDDNYEDVLLSGNFLCFGGMGGFTLGLWDCNENILYSVKRIYNSASDTYDYEITSSKDINDIGNYFTNNTIDEILQEIGLQITNLRNMATIVIDEEFNIESSNPIANRTVAKMAKALDYETGIFGIGDEAWWVYNDNNPNILKFYPYSIEGTYEKAGDFCTITAKVEKVENWKTIYYSLPIPAVASASTVVTAADNQIYNIWTTTQTYDGVDHSVIAIERQDGSNMTRISGEDPNNEDPTSFIEFTLKYKYR